MSSIAKNTNNAGPVIGVAIGSAGILHQATNYARAIYAKEDQDLWDPRIIGFRRGFVSTISPLPAIIGGLNLSMIIPLLHEQLEVRKLHATVGLFPTSLIWPDPAKEPIRGLLIVVHQLGQSKHVDLLPIVWQKGSRCRFGPLLPHPAGNYRLQLT